MAITWEIASPDLIKMAKAVVNDYRPTLRDAMIGFLFRSEAGSKGGRSVIGKAQKVGARLRTLIDLDFIIWISEPDWGKLSKSRKAALLHHELCHCDVDVDDKPFIVGHDIEEFNDVIREHGLWLGDLVETAKAIQPYLPALGEEPTETNGDVVAVDPGQLELEIGEEIQGEDLT